MLACSMSSAADLAVYSFDVNPAAYKRTELSALSTAAIHAASLGTIPTRLVLRFSNRCPPIFTLADVILLSVISLRVAVLGILDSTIVCRSLSAVARVLLSNVSLIYRSNLSAANNWSTYYLLVLSLASTGSARDISRCELQSIGAIDGRIILISDRLDGSTTMASIAVVIYWTVTAAVGLVDYYRSRILCAAIDRSAVGARIDYSGVVLATYRLSDYTFVYAAVMDIF